MSHQKIDFTVSKVRRFMEAGPIVLISSGLKDKRDIPIRDQYMVIEFQSSLIVFSSGTKTRATS